MLRTALSSLAVLVLLSVPARADIAPPEKDPDDGGCTTGALEMSAGLAGVAIVIQRRKRSARRPSNG